MSRVALAFLGVALTISLGQWLSMRVAAQVDLHVLPAHSRRRVQWMLVNTTHIQLACAGLVAAPGCVQLIAGLG